MITIQIKRRKDSSLFSVNQINSDGTFVNRKMPLVIYLSSDLHDLATPGSVWHVDGNSEVRNYTVNDFAVVDELFIVTNAEFVKPSGHLLERWISSNIRGIGEVKARRILRALPNLDDLVKQHDYEQICSVAGISERDAKSIVEKFPSQQLYDVINWLQKSELPIGIADKLCRVYQEKTISVLEENPFILQSLDINFEHILKIISSHSITVDIKHIHSAIVENVLKNYCAKTGSTVISEEVLMNSSSKMADKNNISKNDLVANALSTGAIVSASDGYMLLGHAVQEATVAKFIVECSRRKASFDSTNASWELDFDIDELEEILDDFQSTLPFAMTHDQRDAVIGSIKNNVTVITGGAGTGKTTILQAILFIYDKLAPKLPKYQVALSGRAAQRMFESTAKPSCTIAKLVVDYINDPDHVPDHLLLIIDESSMLDLLSAYKLVGILPKATRIIMVGDVAQLPPVGAGIIFHALVETPNLPIFNLKNVQRQSDQSGIHRVATSVRNGQEITAFDEFNDIGHFDEFSLDDIIKNYIEKGGATSSIILSPVRKGEFGVNNINAVIQQSINSNGKSIKYFEKDKGWIPFVSNQGIVFKLNDQVMITQNNYNEDIRNGDIGTIVEVYDNNKVSYGLIDINGKYIVINYAVLQVLELGYATTIHKSQGSQWQNGIIVLPTHSSFMCNKSILYTAITRASLTLSIFSKIKLFNHSIQIKNIRNSNFKNYLNKYTDNCKY